MSLNFPLGDRKLKGTLTWEEKEINWMKIEWTTKGIKKRMGKREKRLSVSKFPACITKKLKYANESRPPKQETLGWLVSRRTRKLRPNPMHPPPIMKYSFSHEGELMRFPVVYFCNPRHIRRHFPTDNLPLPCGIFFSQSRRISISVVGRESKFPFLRKQRKPRWSKFMPHKRSSQKDRHLYQQCSVSIFISFILQHPDRNMISRSWARKMLRNERLYQFSMEFNESAGSCLVSPLSTHMLWNVVLRHATREKTEKHTTTIIDWVPARTCVPYEAQCENFGPTCSKYVVHYPHVNRIINGSDAQAVSGSRRTDFSFLSLTEKKGKWAKAKKKNDEQKIAPVGTL